MSYNISKEEIIRIFNNVLSMSDIKFSEEKVRQFWNELLTNIEFFLENQETLLEQYDDTFRYRDYYDFNQDAEYSISLLDTLEFCTFCLADELNGISAILLDDSFSDEDKETLFEDESLISKISIFACHAKEFLDIKLQNRKKDSLLPFEKDTKFKIFFSKLSLDDIQNLPRDVVIKFINKLENPLATSLIIPYSEGVGHVNDRYGTSVARIAVAADYRIVYERYKNATIILGITLKNGKNRDYARYDSLVERLEGIHKDVDKFLDGNIDTESANYRMYELLRKIYSQWQEISMD